MTNIKNKIITTTNFVYLFEAKYYPVRSLSVGLAIDWELAMVVYLVQIVTATPPAWKALNLPG